MQIIHTRKELSRPSRGGQKLAQHLTFQFRMQFLIPISMAVKQRTFARVTAPLPMIDAFAQKSRK
jgi:hypothetical protein